MTKLLATVYKELLLLRRDRGGLLVLFVMPAVLVLVITLVQENVLKTVGESETRILLVSADEGELEALIEQKLQGAGKLTVRRDAAARDTDEQQIAATIARGDFQFCVVLPEGLTQAVRRKARLAVQNSLSMAPEAGTQAAKLPVIRLYFDPAVLGGYRSAVRNSLQLMVYGIEVNEKLDALERLLPVKIRATLQKEMGDLLPEALPLSPPDFQMDWSDSPVLRLEEAATGSDGPMPTSVQQNVPAWTLFGIFFIILPLAGSLIKERRDGTFFRLLSLPVPYLTLIVGKILAYVLICLVQIIVIFCIGRFLLPVLGTPSLDMGPELPAIIIVAVSAVLAATGYGTMLGTVLRTYEQASMFGPISVVIAAALGGVMVPVYAMPKIMQQISILSPLSWGLNAFLDLFVRGGSLQTVWPEIAALLSFFLANLAVARIYFLRRTQLKG
jgi:ABC-2 type transport system permease protein